MKRVVTLYRVSTKGQVDKKDDIPMQRRECMAFIDSKEDWCFHAEYMEKGVSGYKVSITDRDAIQEIRKLAEKKKFDVLLVFMFDRLGRREDETPFLVQWFIEHGIEVWSTQEGQQRLDNRGDKLMNFIRYWQAGGESEKTSMRVKAAHTQMTTDGIWRGGVAPFGYKLVHKGRMGKKNRQLYDLEIDEVTGPIVQEVFDLVCNQGYGIHRAANYLNDKYPNLDKVWTGQTVRTMIRNPIYTGRLHMNDTLSEPQEHLRLISNETQRFADYALSSRIPRKYLEQRTEENEALSGETLTKASAYGATLLSGILYCGHCGHRLVGGYCTKQLATHAYHRPIYRCYNGSIKAKMCDGQTVYSAKKIEDAVLEVVQHYFQNISRTVDAVWREQVKIQLRSKLGTLIKQAQAELTKLEKQQTNLKQEVVKSLSGESLFDPQMLKSLLDENADAIVATQKKIEQYQDDREKEVERINYLAAQYRQIADWAEEFNAANNDTKKMILARIIEKITVDRNYHITMTFFITENDFREKAMESAPEMEIVEAEDGIWRPRSTHAG